MTAEAAVAEVVASTETQAAPATESQAPVNTEGTDGASAVQTENPTTETTESTPPPADTEGERLRSEAREAELEAVRQESYEKAKQEFSETKQTAKQKANLTAFHQGFGNAAQQVRSTLSRLTVVDSAGVQRNLTAQEVNSLAIAPFEAHNGFVLGTREEDFNSPTVEAVEALLSKEAYGKFAEKASGKPAKDYLNEFAESKALDTKAVKGMTLEDAESASSKVRSEVAKLRLTLHEAETKAKELNDKYGPEGDPLKGGNTRSTSSGVRWQTKREARDLHAQNKLTTAEMKRINADPTIPDGYS